MALHQRITKTRVAAVQSKISALKFSKSNDGEKMFTILLNCTDNKQRKITFYGDEINLLKDAVNIGLSIKTCTHSCSPGDYCKGGKCDVNGCFS